MKKTFVIILLLVIAGVVGNYYYQKQKNQDQQESTQAVQQSQSEQKPEPQPEPPSNVKTYTMEEVRKHGPESWGEDEIDPRYATCWMVIHGKVYEVPDSFTETHPGGHAIYDGCGTDATELFENRPSDSSASHSADARSILEKFYIGELKK